MSEPSMRPKRHATLPSTLLRAVAWASVLGALFGGAVQADPKRTVVFRDGSRLEVEGYELEASVVVLRTVEGRRQLVPRSLVDVEATLAANPSGTGRPQRTAPPRRSEGTPHPSGRTHAHDAPSGADAHDSHRLSDRPIPLAEGTRRPRPLLELGSPFLGPGRIPRGFRVPGGAVWQPSFLLFGTFRSSAGSSLGESVRTVRWANRLDLFGNLSLTPTERIVVGLRPLDDVDDTGARSFTGYTTVSPDPGRTSGGRRDFNLDGDTVSHLFFEGDFGELFPFLDRDGTSSVDFGMSVGRQPIRVQEGLLINDTFDAAGITRNNWKPWHAVNHLVTAVVGWNGVHRNTAATGRPVGNTEADDGLLLGLFQEIDWRSSTVNLDAVYVRAGAFRGVDGNGAPAEVYAGGGLYLGGSAVQRHGTWNTSLRAAASVPMGPATRDDNPLQVGNPASGGVLLFAETSWTPPHGHDYVYLNGFVGIDDYRAAALNPGASGPLERTGILFASSPVGDPGAVSPSAAHAVGGALGHQRFFRHTRQQILLEVGGRYSLRPYPEGATIGEPHTVAAGARYQAAIGRRQVLSVEGSLAHDSLQGRSQDRAAGRAELTVKF